MAKAIAHSEIAIKGSLSKQTNIERTVERSDLQFTELNGETTMKTKSIPTYKSSPGQEERRIIWCDCDMLYREMTTGQEKKWKEFCKTPEKEGQLKQIMAERKTKSRLTERGKNIGYYAAFMEQCCKWDLLKFLSEFLNAEWRVIYISQTKEKTIIGMEIIDKTIYIEPMEVHELQPQRGLTW